MVDFDKAIQERHSVRQYTPQRIEGEVLEKLRDEIDRVNAESGLSIRLILDEPKAFSKLLLKTMLKFKGAVNYISIIGPESPDLNIKAGYYGEHLVLFAQTLGLNTCWAMMAGKKEANKEAEDGLKTVISISVGYGENQGVPHKNRPISEVADLKDAPDWFVRGVECAMLAPTGMNKQNFKFERDGDKVRLTGGKSALAQIDLGIVKYHFEYGAGKENFSWMDRSS
jgi:nitroreductase